MNIKLPRWNVGDGVWVKEPNGLRQTMVTEVLVNLNSKAKPLVYRVRAYGNSNMFFVEEDLFDSVLDLMKANGMPVAPEVLTLALSRQRPECYARIPVKSVSLALMDQEPDTDRTVLVYSKEGRWYTAQYNHEELEWNLNFDDWALDDFIGWTECPVVNGVVGLIRT
jgi:hypothetical protein